MVLRLAQVSIPREFMSIFFEREPARWSGILWLSRVAHTRLGEMRPLSVVMHTSARVATHSVG